MHKLRWSFKSVQDLQSIAMKKWMKCCGKHNTMWIDSTPWRIQKRCAREVYLLNVTSVHTLQNRFGIHFSLESHPRCKKMLANANNAGSTRTGWRAWQSAGGKRLKRKAGLFQLYRFNFCVSHLLITDDFLPLAVLTPDVHQICF